MLYPITGERLCEECGGVVVVPVPERRFKRCCSDQCAMRLWRRVNAEKIREQNKQWKLQNVEKIREQDRQWKDENRERINAQSRERNRIDPEARRRSTRKWQRDNPEKLRESYRQWRERNPGVSQEQSRRWRAANPERVRELTRRRRARKMAARVENYREADIYERDGWVCQLCGEPVDSTLKYPDSMSRSIDHVIPLSQGGADEPANVQLAHLTCNLRKYATTPNPIRKRGSA